MRTQDPGYGRDSSTNSNQLNTFKRLGVKGPDTLPLILVYLGFRDNTPDVLDRTHFLKVLIPDVLI